MGRHMSITAVHKINWLIILMIHELMILLSKPAQERAGILKGIRMCHPSASVSWQERMMCKHDSILNILCTSSGSLKPTSSWPEEDLGWIYATLLPTTGYYCLISNDHSENLQLRDISFSWVGPCSLLIHVLELLQKSPSFLTQGTPLDFLHPETRARSGSLFP